MKFRVTYVVDMADGEQYTVHADQRDYARMEAADLPRPGIATRARFMAWSAMRRVGFTSLLWERFNEVDAVNVEELDEPDSEGEQSGPPPSIPGRTTGGGGFTSPSPATLASRSPRS